VTVLNRDPSRHRLRLVIWSVVALLTLGIVGLCVSVGMTGRDFFHLGVVQAAMILTLTAAAFVFRLVERRIETPEGASTRATVATVIAWLVVGTGLLSLCAIFFLWVCLSFPL